MPAEKGKSYQKLGQICATLSSGFFVAFGVAISMWGNFITSSYQIISLKHKIAGADYINQTTRNNFLNQSGNIPSNITKVSSKFIGSGTLFFVAGMAFTVLAIFFWYLGHRELKKDKSMLDPTNYRSEKS